MLHISSVITQGSEVSSTMNVRPLPIELEELAYKDLNETPQVLLHGIQHLKDWIAKQPHLNARTDDQWLAAFLRGCKHRVEETKAKLELYYSLRSISPDLYVLKHSDPKFIELFKSGIALILPKRLRPTDPRVVLIRAGQYDPHRYDVIDFVTVTIVHQMLLFMEDDAFMVAGTVNVFDLQGVTMAHLLQMTPVKVKKMTVGGQDASPIRLKMAHFINMHPGFEKVINLAKSFLNEKMKSRFMVHSNMESFHKYVPKEILPFEYGGNGGYIQDIIDSGLKKLQEYGPWLDKDMIYGTDESKRIGTTKISKDMFGVEGSFRQLEFD